MDQLQLIELMAQCGLFQVNKHRWSEGHFVHIDEYIEGDYVSILQLVELVRAGEREAIAVMLEDMDRDGFSVGEMVAAIRADIAQG